MLYRYETHLHTCESSACGIADARNYVPYYQDLGYQGIFVTDHFFGGNTAVNQRLPWPEQVNSFCAGYEAARNEGERRGFQVFFGWEQAFDGDEYLVYGLDKAWLLEHPEVKSWSRADQFIQTRPYAACVVQAHPFRNRNYIRHIHLNTACVDGVEVYNAANHLSENAQAYRYAKNLGLPMLAGSDIHYIPWHTLVGITFTTPLENEQDFAMRVRNKASIGLYVPTNECSESEPEPVQLPYEVLGGNATAIDTPLKTLLR